MKETCTNLYKSSLTGQRNHYCNGLARSSKGFGLPWLPLIPSSFQAGKEDTIPAINKFWTSNIWFKKPCHEEGGLNLGGLLGSYSALLVPTYLLHPQAHSFDAPDLLTSKHISRTWKSKNVFEYRNNSPKGDPEVRGCRYKRLCPCSCKLFLKSRLYL